MRKLAILIMILFVSCQAPSSGVSEADSQTFEQNVQTIKDTWIKGFEEENLEKVISFFSWFRNEKSESFRTYFFFPITNQLS